MASGMNDLAYDISHLAESEIFELDGNHFRTARTSAPAPAPVESTGPSLQALQEAMARELLQAAPVHEALIQQYLGMAVEMPFDPSAS